MRMFHKKVAFVIFESLLIQFAQNLHISYNKRL